MRKLFSIIIALTLICWSAFAEPAVYEGSVAEIAANVLPAVVTVTTSVGEESAQTSGFFFREADEGGYILCPYEAVTGAETLNLTWSDGTVSDAKVRGADPSTGIAVIEFSGEAPVSATPVAFGDSDGLTVGEQIITVSKVEAAGESYIAVSDGIVSSLKRESLSGDFTSSVTGMLAQTAASSGFVVNMSGELVALVSGSESGFAVCVPIENVIGAVEELIANGKISRPMLGIGVSDYDGPEEPIRSHAPIGVMVRHVSEDSSAAEKGLQVYDVITEIDGVRIKSFEELANIVASHAVGDTVTLKVYRYYDTEGNMLPQYEEKTFEIELRELSY